MAIKVKAPTWKNITGAYVKASTWKPVKQIFVKVVNTWRSVFLSDPPVIVTKPSLRLTNTSGTGGTYDGPAATSPQYLNTNLFGKDGSYTNYTSITGRKITYSDTSDGFVRNTIISGDLFTSGVTASDRLTVDEKYLFYELTVSNGTDVLDSIEAVSNPIYMIKSEPLQDTSFTTSLTGQAAPNQVLTFNYYLQNYYYNRVVQADSRIRWWRSTDTTASGYLLKEEVLTNTVTSSSSSVLQGSSTYTVAASADNGFYIVVEVVGVNSWTTYNSYSDGYQIVKKSLGPVTSPYRFSFGKILYVSSNGHIGLDSGGSGYTSLSSGRNISVFVKDLQQYYLAEYSDNSVYYLYFKSYLYNTSASASNALDYQIKFYNDPNINYCDIYIVRKGSSVGTLSDISVGYYESGQTQYAGMMGPYTISAGTVFRVYFGGTAGTTTGISWTSVNNNLWDIIQEWSYPPGLDDSFTAVTSAANQSAPTPVNTSAPTLSTDTNNYSAGSTITINTGTWNNTNSYSYELLYGSSTPIATDSSSTKTLINTNQYVITNADATNPSYYFRGRVTGYQGSGQTGNSAVALSTTSSRSYINPTTTISVGTVTSSGFTISGTAGPLSGFGVTYANITSIQIFNSSQSLISTITTGLPTVNGTTGAWSYIWTGGSSSTTYYAKATVAATDTSQTLFTTGFSSSITTSAGVSTPTSLTATNNSGAIRLTFSGGSGDQYDIYYANSATRPTDGQSFADYPNVTSPYDPPLTARDVERWFWVRKSTGSLRSNWYPSDSSVSIRLPLLTPPTPTITNSAQSSTSLSWYWSQPTPTSTQDEPTSWDYALTQNTNTPSSWTNITTRPTSGSPLVTSSLSSSTTYYLHVRAKNKDATGSSTYASGTTNASTPVYSPVVWGTMASPAFARNASPASSSTSYRWGWNNQTPTSGDYTATNITWEWQHSTSNATTTQVSNPTGLLASGTRPNRQSGGLTVGGSTYNNRVSSLSGDYSSPGNIASASEPVTFSTSARYLRYRAVVVGSDGITYRSNYSAWV